MNELMEKPPLDCWGTLEAMGHQSHTGHITEERFGSVSLFRVDVPALEATPEHDVTKPYSKLYGAASIYCVTPMEEATVLQLLHERAKYSAAYRRPHRLSIEPPVDEHDDPHGLDDPGRYDDDHDLVDEDLIS